MAKTYDVYIAETMYELFYPNTGTQIRCLHFDNVTEVQLTCFKALANSGGMALAYMANEEEEDKDKDNYGPR